MNEQESKPSLKQEDGWLVLSVPSKVLRQGEEGISFALRLRHLMSVNPRLCDKLFGTCHRLHFVEQLRQSQLWVIDENDLLQATLQSQYQVDRLSTYITATCIDVAAGKDKDFKLYPQWLKQYLVPGKLGGRLASMIGALTATQSESETVEELTKWTGEIFEDYLDEAGVARAFKRFFAELPGWLKNWLANTYYLANSDIGMLAPNPEWFALDCETRCKRIADYLFKIRNRYTHTVDYHEPMERGEDARLAFPMNGIGYKFNRLYKDGNLDLPVEMTVGLPYNLSESDVIRFLVIYKLRHWLGMDDDESFIARHWERQEYRRMGFKFLAELEANRARIEEWCSFHLGRNPHGQVEVPIRELKNRACIEFVAKHEAGYADTMSYGFHPYLGVLERINQRIAEFNARFEGRTWLVETQECIQLYRDLGKSSDVDQFIWRMTDLSRNISRRLIGPYY